MTAVVEHIASERVRGGLKEQESTPVNKCITLYMWIYMNVFKIAIQEGLCTSTRIY